MKHCFLKIQIPDALLKTVLFIFVFLLISAKIWATDYYSGGNNTPNSTSNWWTNMDASGTHPSNFTTAGNTFIIQAAHTMTTTATWTVSGTGSDVQVNGTLIASHAVSAPTWTFNSGSTYQHNQNGGTIPTATWAATSTCLITGITSTMLSGGWNQAFGNFTWNCTGQSIYPTAFTPSSMSIQGNLTVASTGGGVYDFSVANGSSPQDVTIGGDLIITGGTYRVCYNYRTTTVNVNGNISVSGGTLQMNSSDASSYTGTINLAGNLSISNGSIDLSKASTGRNGVININGNFSQTGGTITESGSATTNAINFSGTTSQTFSKTGGTITNTVNFNILNNAIVDFGTSILDDDASNAATFSINAGGTIITANTNATGALTTSGANGSIQVGGSRTYNTGANYTYDGTTAQVTGNGLTSANNLTIDNSAGVTLSNAVSVSGTLTLTNGILTTTSTNLLSVTNTATSAISGGSGTSFINGPVKWTLPSNLSSGSNYNFPVGKVTTYLPFVLVNPTTGSGTVTAQIEAFTASTGGTYDATLVSISTTEYWSLVTAGNFSSSRISLSRQTAISPLDVIGGSTTLAGIYSTLAGTAGTYGVIVSNPFTTNRFFVLAGMKQTITTGTISGSPFCAGTAVSVPFTIAGTFTSGNIFTAQLSNSTGSFASPVAIGSLTSTTAGTISGTIPSGTSAGTGYRIRVESNTPAITGTDNGSNLTVNPNLPVSVSIGASANPVCSGTSVTFTATPTNGGTTPVYQWKVNGANVGTNSVIYSYTPVNNDAVTCVLTSNATCATGSPATSNTVTMTVNPNLPVSISIAPSANPVCTGTSVTFTATPTNGGASPSYQWKVNGINSGTDSPTYNYVPANNETITCVLTSNASPCATGNPATSNTVTMTVNPNLPVSISIAPSANPVCAGTSVTFTATPTNGGASPSYQWKVNGINSGTDSPTYNYVPVNNDAITCELTSSVTCPTGNPATSNTINMVVNQVEVNATIGVLQDCYTTVKAAFDNINNGRHKGEIIIKVHGSTIESASAVLNASGSGSSSYTSVLLYPTSTGLSITGNLNTPLIDLNGADNVTFNGSINAVGTNKNLTISNSSSSNSASTSTIRFINDANSNSVLNCTIEGSSTSVTTGTIFFSTATVSGNSTNTISNNTITSCGSNLPYNAVFSLGTVNKMNSNNNITDNVINDYFHPGGFSSGILVSTYNNGWTITGNKIFQTASRNATAAINPRGIQIISSTGVGFTVNNNIIGFANTDGTGVTAYTGNFANIFRGIEFTVGTSSASNVQGNTISGISLTSSTAIALPGAFNGITILAGTVNIGTTNGNIIGAATGTNAISITSTTTLTNLSGIYSTSTNNVSIQNNTIGAINTGVGSAAIGYIFSGIYTAGTLGNYTISNNSIGSPGSVNSISIGTDGVTTTGVCTFNGINNAATGTISITGNIIQNVTVYGTGASVFNGILNSAGSVTLDINSNNIISGKDSGTGAFIGISNTSTAATTNINSNVLRNISRTTATGTVTGISSTGAIPTVLNINGNHLGNNDGGFVTYDVATVAAATLVGINVTNATGASALSIQNNDIRGIVHTLTGASPHTYIINAAATKSQNISNNTFTNLDVNTTGNVTFISNSVIIPANGSQTVSGNSIVTGFNKSGAGGTVTLFTSTVLTVASGITVTHQNNNFSYITLNGAAIIAGWVHTDAGQSVKTFTGNIFDNWTTGAASITGLTVTGFGGISSVSGNTISNLNGQAAITGISLGASGVATALDITNNTISNLKTTSTATTGIVTGISSANLSPAINISNNVINTLSSSGAGPAATVFGINITAGVGVNVNANTIYSLSASGTLIPIINGISAASTGTVSIQSTTIYGVNTTGAATSGFTFNGITTTGAGGNFTISGNTIGSTTMPNSIAVGTNGVTTTGVCTFVGISSASTGINSITNNTIQNVTTYGTGASTIQAINCSGNPIGAGIGSTLNITGNNIISNSNYGTGILRGISNAVGVAANPLGTVNINNNVIRSNKIYSASGTFTGIAGTGATTTGIATTAINIKNNHLGNTDGGLVNYENANSGILTGITTTATQTTCIITIQGNDFRGIGYTTAGTNAHSYISNTSIAFSHVISDNTFTDLNVNTTSNITFITNSAAMVTNGTQTVSNNSIVTAFNKGGVGNTVTGITSTAATANSGVTVSVENNNFSNITVTGATAISGIVNTDAGTGVPQKRIKNNTLENWTGGTGILVGMSLNGTGLNGEVSQNMIRNFSNGNSITGITTGAGNDNIYSNQIYSLNANTTAATVVTGISVTAATTKNVYLNTIYNLNTGSGITTGSVRGIAISGGTTVNIYQNTINSLTGSSLTTVTSGSINGIAISGGSNINVSRNKIYDLVSSSTALTGTINGIVVSGTTASLITSISNNIIGNLRVTAGSGADLIRGISVSNTGANSNINVYYNTVYLNAGSTGTNFGTSGIFHTASATATTAALDLRNNIIINTSTPNGTGRTIAFRRSAVTLSNYVSSSNNNLFYSGTPGTVRLIYSDATNSDQTLSAFQTRVSPREGLSVTEDMITDLKFLSVNGADADYLHLNITKVTQVESGGANISGVTVDFDGDIRQGNDGYIGEGTAPDIGADEFESCVLYITSVTAAANPICFNATTILTANGVAGINALVTWWTGTGGTGTNLGTGLTLITGTGTYYARVTNGCGVPVEAYMTVLPSANSGEWTGNINTDWANGDNWCTGVLPTSSTNVIINSSATRMPVINSSAVCNNLTIDAGARLTISATGTLNVAGTLTNSAGNAGLRLQSDATGTASLIHNTINVPATVERYISGAVEEWHFLSSPVSSQSINGSWTPSGTYGNGTGYDLYVWNESNSCWIYNLDFTSIVNWNTVHPGSVFNPGRGYLYSVQATNPIKEFAGNLNSGAINYPITFNGNDVSLKGFNLVGNPYPSSIDWQSGSGWSRSDLVGSGGGYDIWIWNPTANNYGVFNSTTGSGTNGITRYIAPMQGFFVRAASAGNLGMNNSVRVHEDAGDWKNAKINSGIFSMVIQSETNKSFDESRLLFGYAGNQSGAAKLFSPVITAPSLYLPLKGNYYSVRYLTDTVDNPMVAVMFKAGIDGNYTLNCNFDDSEFETVRLEDRQTHTIQNLKEEKTYRFKALKTDDKNRFLLYFGSVNINSDNELMARVFTNRNGLIVDLSLISKETEIIVYDIWGRKLSEQKLQGGTLYNLNINAVTQLLIVRLQNINGSLSRKLLWSK